MTNGQLVLMCRARKATTTSEAFGIRVAAYLSQREVADAIGVHPATVSRWEAGLRVPRGLAAARYGRLLNELENRQ
jgi:DNA-binding transcriptional regulator YiaG